MEKEIPTHILEQEYMRLCLLNKTGYNKDIIETIDHSIDSIAAILYNRQEERETIEWISLNK